MGISLLIAKLIGKQLAKATTKTAAKEGGITFTGIHPPVLPPIPFYEKIRDLATDRGLCESYVRDLIKDAKSTKSLYPIKKYLESSRNDLPYNVTRQMLGQIARKLANLKKELVEAHADDIVTWLL